MQLRREQRKISPVKKAHETPYASADPYPYTLAKLGKGKLNEARGAEAVMKSSTGRVADVGKLTEVPDGMDPGHYNVTEV